MRNKDEGEIKEFKLKNAWLVEEIFENIVVVGGRKIQMWMCCLG